MSLYNKVRRFTAHMLLGFKASSDAYISHLRKLGVFIGDDVKIFAPNKTTIDLLNPHLISIGSNVIMTGPVTILTHDYSVGVCKIYL